VFVDGELVAVPPGVPKENFGAVAPAAAPPNKPPEAGAVDVALFEGAPEELGVPKLKDMVA
jgi:hypothetical protein